VDFATGLLRTGTLEGEDFFEFGMVPCWGEDLFKLIDTVLCWGEDPFELVVVLCWGEVPLEMGIVPC